MSIRASIDIGSNSTLLLVMNSETRNILDERSTITSLGKDLDKNGVFLDTTMNATYDALKNYAEICKEHGIEAGKIIVTATEASRVAKNAKEFFEKVKSELGVVIQTITGEGEAYYTAFGITKMLKGISDESAIIMDVGGASTELIDVNLKDFEIENSISLPVGSVRTTDWINEKIDESKFEEAFSNHDFNIYKGKRVICVAGTMTTLALMMSDAREFDASLVNNLESSLEKYDEFVSVMTKTELSTLEREAPHLGKRAFSIKGGAQCALRVLNKIEANELSFSTYGLRYGTLLNGVIDGRYLV